MLQAVVLLCRFLFYNKVSTAHVNNCDDIIQYRESVVIYVVLWRKKFSCPHLLWKCKNENTSSMLDTVAVKLVKKNAIVRVKCYSAVLTIVQPNLDRI